VDSGGLSGGGTSFSAEEEFHFFINMRICFISIKNFVEGIGGFSLEIFKFGGSKANIFGVRADVE